MQFSIASTWDVLWIFGFWDWVISDGISAVGEGKRGWPPEDHPLEGKGVGLLVQAPSLLTLMSLKPLALRDLMIGHATPVDVAFFGAPALLTVMSFQSLSLHALMLSQPSSIGSIVIPVTVSPNHASHQSKGQSKRCS